MKPRSIRTWLATRPDSTVAITLVSLVILGSATAAMELGDALHDAACPDHAARNLEGTAS